MRHYKNTKCNKMSDSFSDKSLKREAVTPPPRSWFCSPFPHRQVYCFVCLECRRQRIKGRSWEWGSLAHQGVGLKTINNNRHRLGVITCSPWRVRCPGSRALGGRSGAPRRGRSSSPGQARSSAAPCTRRASCWCRGSSCSPPGPFGPDKSSEVIICHRYVHKSKLINL